MTFSFLWRLLELGLGSKSFSGKVRRSSFLFHRPLIEVLECRTLLSSVAVGDFNGDGHPDLAVPNAAQAGPVLPSGTMSILLGNGDGSFQPAVSYSVGDAPNSVAVGDFNGDGKLDLAVANYFGTVS